MPFPLYDEPCLVALQLEYFYDHAPMFGDVKTINVWVDQEPAAIKKENLIKESLECKSLAVHSDVGEVP
jgi:uncharacterized protein YwqG